MSNPPPAPSLKGRGTKGAARRHRRRATVLLMIVALLAMLFMLVSAYIILARFDRQTLQMTSRANEVERILDGVSAVAAAAVRGPRGSDLVSGTSYVDIPGYGGDDPNGPWGSPWLASGEPVRNPGGGYYPGDYGYPAVSGFSGPATTLGITHLTLDADEDGTAEIVPVASGLPDPATDTLRNSREPFSDADGDGMPDSRFGSVGLLTEMANALGGRSVRATGIDPAYLVDPLLDPNNAANYLAWQQYDSTARYAVAAKIVSHGGMVQVSAPTDVSQWNSEFIGGMFNWIRHPSDTLYPFVPGENTGIGADDRARLQAMWAARGSVEPALRRRGGIIGGTGANTDVGEPFALRTLSNRFRWTFGGAYDSATEQYRWQRFNLASLDDWNAWRQAATIDPYWYNEWFESGGMSSADQRLTYAQRQLLTTVNHSDELARDQDPNVPNSLEPLGIRAGDMKFYLGKITDTTLASNDVPLGAFYLDGSFNDVEAITGHTMPRGLEIVWELATYFSEMLRGYDDWDDGTGGGTEAVTREEQAFMLAVNAVAFAAPRMPTANDHVDAVYYLYNGNTYVGYAPQPFITQVVAYNDAYDPNDPNDPNGPPDPNDPNDVARVALAIELYNPNDPVGAGNLDLQRYAISLNGTFDPNDPNSTCQALATSALVMSGRTFAVTTVNAQVSNTKLDAYATHPAMVLGNLPRPHYTSSVDPISVQLLRRGADGSPVGWYVVDQFDVKTDGYADTLSPGDDWYVTAERDTTYEPYLGTLPSGATPQARWRMTVAFPKTDPVYEGHADGALGTPDFATLGLGSGSGSPADALNAFSPCVPLYTMNADAVHAFIHGAARPASFPTTGFMLFVPRFSHMIGAAGRVPVTEVLYNQWRRRPNTVTSYPADFGHMPVFDNRQGVEAGSAFADSRTGRVPWGLLVFDYFTTLNPDDADGDGVPWQFDPGDTALDPYRVPGRININTASWYVLAGLPLIGPDGSGNLPLDPSASPAFWNAASGVLAGMGSETPQRSRSLPMSPGDPLFVIPGDSTGQWYRLGPALAQAAAAYRDRVPYVSIASPFGHASARNSSVWLQYRPALYGPSGGGSYESGIRGGGNFDMRGFLTLGELANVMGFDGSRDTDITAALDGTGTVLGGYGYGVGGDFMKAVSLLALLDTHFLTTRSNTFTVYATLYDRENPQASVRSQVTLDRSNLLPRLLYTGGDWVTLQDTGSPELIARRDYSYFNAQYDQ